MNILTILMLAMALLGALDRILGCPLGLGQKFEQGITTLGSLALTMIGMIVLAPAIGAWLGGLFAAVNASGWLDASFIPAMLFANDMGGASLARTVAAESAMGDFNGLVVASMMGCTLSFTLPYAVQKLEQSRREPFFFGILCGVATIPVGCFVAGLWMHLPVGRLLLDLLPLALVSALIALGLRLAPAVCIKLFIGIGEAIKILVTLGLAIGIIKSVTGWGALDCFGSIEEGGAICLDIAVVLAGAFPLMALVERLAAPLLARLGRLLGVEDMAASALLSTAVNNVLTVERMGEMSARGVTLNAAFAVSASFLLADHLAFTAAFSPEWVAPVMLGKLISGLCGLGVAIVLRRRNA